VDYVGTTSHDFVTDIEERERAGTPGVLQVLKAALAFEVKDAIGTERITAREHALMERAFARWRRHERIEILGNPDPARRIAIVSFNVRAPEGGYLHPKFVTTLANDLFGLQTRAGCSCAGPYGHRLLHIDAPTSDRYRACILKGVAGIKPGWCRVGFHYCMDDAEADYIIDSVEFIASEGHRFLPLYRFDTHTGAWAHMDEHEHEQHFSLHDALSASHFGATALDVSERRRYYTEALDFARKRAAGLTRMGPGANVRLDGEAGALQFFALPAASVSK